jgi:pimeloyl-ACP methyl ester carboxylesterase
MGATSNLTKKSTSKFIVNDKNLFKQEREVLEYSGVQGIKSKNVQVDEFEGKPVCIRTHMINIQDVNTKPLLIFVHGYAASSSLYYQIFKSLSECFCLVVTDIIGMGASSRPRDYNKDKLTAEESIEYFVAYFEKWRIAFS